MTFIEFKKLLLDADITLPKFANLIKVSEKNIQAYKKKEEVPNAIAVIAKCFAELNKRDIEYKNMIKELSLERKSKNGGFKKKFKESNNIPQKTPK